MYTSLSPLFFSLLFLPPRPLCNIQHDQVLVHYHPSEVDRFISLADAIEDAHPDLMCEGVEVEGDASAFEVILGEEEGDTLFSRKALGGRFPTPEEVVEMVATAMQQQAQQAAEQGEGQQQRANSG
jgi:hypothetical protein